MANRNRDRDDRGPSAPLGGGRSSPAGIVQIATLVGVGLLVYLMLDPRSSTYNWVAWALAAVLVARVGWFVWRSSATPARCAGCAETRPSARRSRIRSTASNARTDSA